VNLPALVIAICIGIGFGYATLGVLSIIGTGILGYRLWWLEMLMALVFGSLSFVLFHRVFSRQSQRPVVNRGERAIWRLAYRRGFELSLEQIVNETLLDEGAALNALRELEANGQAVALEGNRWRLVTR
jgi:hypothetical protein